MEPFLWTLGGTGFIFLMTCLRLEMVFFFRKPSGLRRQKIFLGFAAGVMIAASVWSLLNHPSCNKALMPKMRISALPQ
jgi:ZIP family zinc transporter